LTCWPHVQIPYYVSVSRLFFASAMDRTFPMAFAKVNTKGTPTNSMLLVLALAFVGLFLIGASPAMYAVLQSWFPFGAYNFFWLFGLSAMLLPYVKPEIIERSPVRKTIAGIHVVTWLGVVAFVIGLWLIGYGFFRSGVQALSVTVIAELIGFVILAFMMQKTKQEGIDMRAIYGSLPPE